MTWLDVYRQISFPLPVSADTDAVDAADADKMQIGVKQIIMG